VGLPFFKGQRRVMPSGREAYLSFFACMDRVMKMDFPLGI
jgi:hypothetical protein